MKLSVKTVRLTALLICMLVVTSTLAIAAPGRYEQELSGSGWHLWLDHAATWWDDDVYMPPVDVGSLPVNPPTCGWETLESTCDKVVDVPGTVEAHYWGEIGGAIPDVGGDYIGVSWWSTTFTVDPDLKGKRIILDFESANLRAEVFVNRKLVGYDVIANTPFEVDATDAINFGGKNTLAVRITDPVGNFTWNDNVLYRWGKNLVPGVHGFGGITGPVILRATDKVHVDDIYVQNQPDPKQVKVFATIGNSTGKEISGDVTLTIHEWRNPIGVVYTKTVPATVGPDGAVIDFFADCPDAKLWELSGYRTWKQANLYEANVSFNDGKVEDTGSQRFGFRFFTVGEKNGDKRFYLNGKRTFIFAAMTRGFWPTNGIFATPEMADRDMNMLIDMGFNMMLLHRAIGQPPVIDYADRMGLMTYEEPGGYRIMPNKEDGIDGPDQQAHAWREEKLRRMIIRDRSLPSMVIYNFKNEATKAPDEYDIKNMKMVFELDPSRILTYNSDRNRTIPYDQKVNPDPFKAHMLPFDDTIYYYGWWDHHHWFAFPGYVDDNYENPNFYARGVINAPTAPAPTDSLLRLDEKEIIFWGEEGAFGTMVRLEKIRDRLKVTGATGFREMEHLDWFEYYDTFLNKSGFRKAYGSVDNLTMSMGRNLHYFHGRNLENIRMSNVADGYNMNGWGSAGTRTDLVDMYRNPTACPSIVRHYSQPLYVAVKLRDKVMPVGFEPIADFWIINELDLHGSCTLEVSFDDPDGNTIMTKEYPVNVLGGEEFGQLLVEGVQLPKITKTGYSMLNARIVQDGIEKAAGFDDIFAVDYSKGSGFPKNCAVIEDDDTVASFLKDARGVKAKQFETGMGNVDLIIVGYHTFSDSDKAMFNDVMKRVQNGTKLVVLNNADKWAELINEVSHARPAVYEGGGIIRHGQQGRYFVGCSPYLDGLPQAQGMSWEYQWFYHSTFRKKAADITYADRNRGQVGGLRLHDWGTETIVALGSQGAKEILSGLARIQLGEGNVFLCTMRLIDGLGSDTPQSAVPKKLLLNLLEDSGNK